MQTGLHVLLHLAQGGWLQDGKVDLDLVGVGGAHGGLQLVKDVHQVAQFLAWQPVDVQAELVLLFDSHLQGFFVRAGGVSAQLRLWPGSPDESGRSPDMGIVHV